MMTRDRAAFAVSALVALALSGLAIAARAQDADAPRPPVPADRPVEPGVWITEVDRAPDTGQVELLLNVGRDMGLERGDALLVEREGKTIARATVFASYADVSVATVDELLEKGTVVARGDWIRPKATHRPARPVVSAIVNKVTAVNEGRATIEGGRNMGLHAGDEATVIRDGRPVARVKLEIVNDTVSGGPILDGDVKVGDKVEFTPAEHARARQGQDPLSPALSPEELRRLEKAAEQPRGIDFVAASFLGVVGEIEHPMPFVAPCHIGVLVRRVIDGSPAEGARIRPGDRVIGIDDRVVRTPSDIYRGVQRRAADFVKVTIVRDDVIQTVSADFRRRY